MAVPFCINHTSAYVLVNSIMATRIRYPTLRGTVTDEQTAHYFVVTSFSDTSGVKAPGIMILINLNNWAKNFPSTAAVSFFFLLPFDSWMKCKRHDDLSSLQCYTYYMKMFAVFELAGRIWNENGLLLGKVQRLPLTCHGSVEWCRYLDQSLRLPTKSQCAGWPRRVLTWTRLQA